MKKRALLIVGLALLIAAAGIVYAHWTDTLTKNVNVTAGTLNVEWTSAYTDDDGSDDYPGEEDNLGDAAYDRYPGVSSIDPTSGWVYPDGFAQRTDKDVAYCHVVSVTADTLTVQIDNGYPFYYCSVLGIIENKGSVPVKIQSMTITVTPVTGGGGSGDVVVEIPEDLCGDQIDPGASKPIVENLHLVEAAVQSGTYTVTETFNFINWNEYNTVGTLLCSEPDGRD